jgi:uncharacterized membrane protein YgcG
MTAVRSLVACLLLLVGMLGPAAGEERVLSFVSDVTVERNGDLKVTETIRVQAEGRQIRRGILRDFPTTYSRRDGMRVIVGFHVESVRRDGAPETFATEGLANGVRVRIGQADRMLTTGTHEYVIRYRTTRQIGFFADFDELYWNATGTGWTFAIDMAEARITLPERVPLRQSAAYTGPQGARGQDARIVEQQPGRIVFRTTRPLPPANGLTVATAWQKGIVEPPGGMQQTGWWFHDNPALVVAGGGLLIVLGFYLYAWRRVGRDPPRGTIIPLFAPPDGMSAAAVRYVDRMEFDDRCFTAAIIELAVKGRLKIDGRGEQPVVETSKGGAAVGRAEAIVAARLFATKPFLVLDPVNHEIFGNAKDALRQELENAHDDVLFADNYLWSGVGFVLTVLAVVAIAVAIAFTYGADAAGGLIFGMVLPAVAIMVGTTMIRNGWRFGRRGWVVLLAGVLVTASAVLIGLYVMVYSGAGVTAVLPALAAYVLAPVAALGFQWLKAPTRGGREIMDKIAGFKEYLGVAEEERLEFLNPPDKTPELFERFLPYAIALDVENTWAQRFSAVLAAAAVGAGAAAVTGTTWYQGDCGFSDPVNLVDRLGSDFSSAVASAATAPGSDSGGGSSGGGSSGGGGGGGGGSGW